MIGAQTQHAVKTLISLASAGLMVAAIQPAANATFAFTDAAGNQGSYTDVTSGGVRTITTTGGAQYTFSMQGVTYSGGFVGTFDYTGGTAGGLMQNVQVWASLIPYGDYNRVGSGQNQYGTDFYNQGRVLLRSGTTQKIQFWNTANGTSNALDLTLNAANGLADNGSTFTFTGSTGNDTACESSSTTANNFCGNRTQNLSGLQNTGRIKSLFVPVPSPSAAAGLVPLALLAWKRRKTNQSKPA